MPADPPSSPDPTSKSAQAAKPRNPASASSVPVPTEDGFMSTQAKMSLADIALALRDEQLEAKVVHYKAELETSAELDAITAQVVRELQSLQAARRSSSSTVQAVDRGQLEIDLIQSLKEMLGRLFRVGKLATVFERKLAEVAKRFARVFFESELHDKIRGSSGEAKVMRFAEQALYQLFAKNEEALLKQLAAFDYASPEVAARAKEEFLDHVKELRNGFLSRTTPELNNLVKFLNEVLTLFFTRELPQMLGELSWEVVKEARLADSAPREGYKIPAEAFPRFRQTFERRFLQRLVPFAEDEMLKRVRESQVGFRAETIRFVADPLIFSDVCEIICNAVYDSLYNDGFLDLPSDWRARLQTTG
jgi:hypothetical protein